jgi:hypothetical protein
MPTSYSKTTTEKIEEVVSLLVEASNLFITCIETARKEGLSEVYVPITQSNYKSLQGILRLAETTAVSIRKQVREKKLGLPSEIEASKRRSKQTQLSKAKKKTKREPDPQDQIGGEK